MSRTIFGRNLSFLIPAPRARLVAAIVFAALLASGSKVHATISFSDGGSHVIGPGASSTVFVINATSVTALDGTQIVPPVTNGSGSTTAIAPDAFELRGGSYLEVMGGQFHGGDANYTGDGFGSHAVGGDGLQLNQSTGVIHKGDFFAGNGHATNSFGNLIEAHPGDALLMIGSHVTIYDGTFTAGAFTRSVPPPTLSGQSIEIVNGSLLEMYGGTTSGPMQLTNGSTLILYGSNFSFTSQSNGQTVTGNYPDGTPFTHSLLNSLEPRYFTIRGDSILIGAVPEPASAGALLLGIAVLALTGRNCIRRTRLERN